jgi:hypothetical protein
LVTSFGVISATDDALMMGNVKLKRTSLN